MYDLPDYPTVKWQNQDPNLGLLDNKDLSMHSYHLCLSAIKLSQIVSKCYCLKQSQRMSIKCVCMPEVTLAMSKLCNPVDHSPLGFSVHGILQARILEQVANFLLQGIFPTQGLNPPLLYLLHWWVDSLPLAPPGYTFPVAYSHHLFTQMVTEWSLSQSPSVLLYFYCTSVRI